MLLNRQDQWQNMKKRNSILLKGKISIFFFLKDKEKISIVVIKLSINDVKLAQGSRQPSNPRSENEKWEFGIGYSSC